jgi:hypothetical protein
MSDARKQRLVQFVAWAADHVTGDEKGQAQIFLDRLFQAFGQKGYLDVGGTTEFRVRRESLSKIKGGLRAVNRTLELPGKNPLKDAHAALDAAVLDAYGFSAKRDLLAQLLALNREVARRIEKSENVTAPGIPPDFPTPERLITDDCIRPT